jgi:hypothetical protein
MKLCSIEGCEKPLLARGWCSAHWTRWQRYGDPSIVHSRGHKVQPLAPRFWSKVDKTGECWLWTASTSRLGYGMFSVGDRMIGAHRIAYELIVGPIPEGLVIDHLCFTRNCVNPDHLEPVTQTENLRRMGGRKTHCPHGHEYTVENSYINRDGTKACRTCHRESGRRRYAKRKLASL